MEVLGICSICGNSGKMHTCVLCGSNVCADCFSAKTRTCISCSRIKAGGKDREEDEDGDDEDSDGEI